MNQINCEADDKNLPTVNASVSFITSPLNLFNNGEKFVKDEKNTYAILKTFDVASRTNKIKKIIINSNCHCSSIELVDFPKFQYTLDIFGKTIATSSNNNIFDLTDSNTLESIKNITAETILQPLTENNNYLDLTIYGTYLNLNYPSNLILNKKHEIRVCGYFLINNKWIWKKETIFVYPYNTYECRIDGPTDSLDLKLKFYNNLENAKIIVMIDNEQHYTYTFNQNYPENIKLKFKTLSTKFLGSHNKCLSDYINTNSLNFSRVQTMHFVLLNCELINVKQYQYVIYTYPGKKEMFST